MKKLEYRVEHPWRGILWVEAHDSRHALFVAAEKWGIPVERVARKATVTLCGEHPGFTDQELEEMARADREIEEAFQDGAEEEEYTPPKRQSSDLMRISKLARAHRMSYGAFVARHSEEELEQMLREEADGRGGSTVAERDLRSVE